MGLQSTDPVFLLGLLTKVMTVNFPTEMGKSYTEYAPGFMARFPMSTEPIGNNGVIEDFQVGPTDNSRNTGRQSSTTEEPRARSQEKFDSILIKPAHINTNVCPVEFNWADLEYLTDARLVHRMGWNMATRAYDDAAAKKDIGYYSDRRAVIADVVAQVNNSGSATDDSTNSRYTFTLYLGARTQPAMLTVGRRLHVVATHATAIATVRNYHTPIVVIDDCKPDSTTVAGGYYSVLCAQSYDATDITEEGGGSSEGQTEINNALGNIVSTDLVTPWGSATNDPNWDGTGGPNYGYWGLLDLFARTDIQSAGGACSTALTTFEGGATAGTTVTRAAAGNFGWLVPKIVAKGGAQIVWNDIDTLSMWLNLQSPMDPFQVLLMNSLVAQSLASQAGTDAIRLNVQANSAASDILAMWGVSGVVYRSIVGKPVMLAIDDHLPPSVVLSPKQGCIKRFSPKAAAFAPGTMQGIWSRRRGTSSGNLNNIIEAHLHESSQLFPTDQLRLSGAVTGGTP